jgi:integrase
MRGSLTKRGKESWRYRFDGNRHLDGNRKVISGTIRSTTKKAAEEELRAIMAKHDKGDFVGPNKRTLKEYFEHWLPVIKPSVAPKTFEAYEQKVKKNIIPLLGRIRLQSLELQQIEEAYSKMLTGGRDDGKGGLAPKTIRNIHGILSHALGKAVRWKYITNNPATGATLPKAERKELQVLTKEDLAILLHELEGRRIYMPVLIAATTGMRRGEILALKWSSINLEEGWLRVVQSLEQTKEGLRLKDVKTKHGRRKISLPPITVQAFRAHMTQQSEELLRLGVGRANDALVFTKLNGEMRNPWGFSDDFSTFVRNLDIPYVSLHGLRHTHISHLLEDGYPIKTVSSRAGHASVSITLDVYGHLLPDSQEKLAAAYGADLEQLMERAENTDR